MKLIKYVVVISLFFSFISCQNKSAEVVQDIIEVDTIPEKVPVKTYGFYLDSFDVFHDEIKDNWTMSHMLLPHGLGQFEVNEASRIAADSTIGLRYIVPNKEYYVLSNLNDSTKKAQYVIYVKNKVDYYVFDFRDSVVVEHKQRDFVVTERIVSGEIVDGSNLTFAINQELQNIALTYELSESIAGIYAWSIDFFKLHPGDAFKVLLDEKRVDGELVGIDNVKAVWFNHHDHPYYSFEFTVDSTTKQTGFFDEEAKQMKRPFLMAPVKYSRISSGYQKRRFHPVQKRWKSHKGTDYAAPKGTPIVSTADGIVIAAKYSKYNGNFVKVKHNDTYSTQYLHMTKRADGMKKGVHVKQGQTIGYVGSTGLATGPHVCYRFWKNGKQVNHRAEKFPNSVPMKDSLIPSYKEFMKPIKQRLDAHSVTPYNIPQNDSIQ